MTRVLESTTRATSTPRTMSAAKAVKKERRAKEKYKERTRSQRQIRVSRSTAGHVASGDTRRMSVGKGTRKPWEEVPSSSASSVAPSAATTFAAAKTAASIRELNDEQEPGWIFGLMGGSVSSVTTGTDDLWDKLVLDSGSLSTVCPYAWCSDISVNDGDKVHLQDIQQSRILSHGSRVVLLELWGPEGRVERKVKFDVADVACPDESLGKMIESGFTFSFDDYKCHVHKGNQRVEIFRKGRTFVLKMRRRWLESKAQMVAPIDEVAEEEMELMTMEKEQEVQEQNHVRMYLEMNHHHHDHEKHDQVQYGQEQKLCGNTI